MREIALIWGNALFRKPIFIGYAEKKEPLAAETRQQNAAGHGNFSEM